MNWSVEFFPLIPTYFLLGACIAAVVLGCVLMFWQRRGVFFRVVCFLLLMLVLSNPHLKQEDREPLKNIVVAVVDQSASQSVAQRREAARIIRKKLQKALGELEDVEIRWVTTKNQYQSGRRENDGTQLFADLRKALLSVPSHLLAGVFLVTDGQVHDAPKRVQELGLKVPVHTLFTGGQGEFDQRIEIVKAPRFGLIGSRAKMVLRVQQYGDPKRFTEFVVVRIKRENGTVETRTVRPGVTFEADVMFPHAGANIVEIDLEAAKGELTLRNNKAAVVAQGVRENLKVLLVSGEPHAGERTWRNLLNSDASVELVHFTILRPPEKLDATPINQLSLIAFPTQQLFSEKLHEFDLIIFDRYRRRGVLPFLYLDNIARYVEKGGAILVAAGSTYSSPLSLYLTPLSQVLPATPTGQIIEKPYRARVTEGGLKHPVTRDLPGGASDDPTWGRWFRLIEVKPKSGNILMSGHDNKPLLVLNRVGKGRVALLLSDHAWLWARGYDGGGPHLTLLRRLAHWLMKEPDLEEEFLGAVAHWDRLEIERRSLKDKVGPVRVQTPDGSTRTLKLEQVKPGVWKGSIKAETSGLYRFNSDNLSAIAHTGVLNSLEMSNVAATSELLKPVMEHTGGGAFWPVRGGRILNDTDRVRKLSESDVSLPRITSLRHGRAMFGSNWMGIRDRQAYRVQGVVHIPLFNGLLALLLIGGLIVGMWYREGR